MFVAASRVLALSAVAFALGSCAQLQDLLAQLPKPTANVVGVNFQDLSTEALTLGFDVDVKNPYSAALPLGKLDFSLASADTPFVTGLVDAAQSIPAKSNGLVKLPVTIKFKELLGTLQHVKPGQVVPYVAKFNLGVDAPGVGPMNLPLEKTGSVPVPTWRAVELAGMTRPAQPEEGVVRVRVQGHEHERLPVRPEEPRLRPEVVGRADREGVRAVDAGVRTEPGPEDPHPVLQVRAVGPRARGVQHPEGRHQRLPHRGTARPRHAVRQTPDAVSTRRQGCVLALTDEASIGAARFYGRGFPSNAPRAIVAAASAHAGVSWNKMRSIDQRRCQSMSRDVPR